MAREQVFTMKELMKKGGVRPFSQSAIEKHAVEEDFLDERV